jgi:hypothetical protein
MPVGTHEKGSTYSDVRRFAEMLSDHAVMFPLSAPLDTRGVDG